MAREKTAIYHLLTKEELERVISHSCSHSDALRKMGYVTMSGNLTRFKKYIKELGISTSHFLVRGVQQLPNKDRECKMFTEKSEFPRSSVKSYILKHKIIEEKCDKCEQLPMWKGEKLVLILDHVNGVPNDNRLENLRFLCPNCNSQTPTFGARNKKHVNSSNFSVPETVCVRDFLLKNEGDLYERAKVSNTLPHFFQQINMSKSELRSWCKNKDICFKNFMVKISQIIQENRKKIFKNGRKVYLRDIPVDFILNLLRKHGSILGAAREIGVSDRGLQRFLERNKIEYEELVCRHLHNDKQIKELMPSIVALFEQGVQPKEISRHLGVSLSKIKTLKSNYKNK